MGIRYIEKFLQRPLAGEDENAVCSLQWELIFEGCKAVLSTDLDFEMEKPAVSSDTDADDAAESTVELAKFNTKAKLALLEALREALDEITLGDYPETQKVKETETRLGLITIKELLNVFKPLVSEVKEDSQHDLKRLNDCVSAFRVHPLTKKMANLRLSEWVIKTADDIGLQIAKYEKNRARMLQVVSRIKSLLADSTSEDDRKAVGKTELAAALLAGATRQFKELIADMKKLEATGGAVLRDVAEYQEQRQKMLERGEQMLVELQRQYTIRVTRYLGEWTKRVGLGRMQGEKAAKTFGEKLVACMSNRLKMLRLGAR